MKVLNAISDIARQKDVLLVLVFGVILMMIMLPLPTFLMDVLITLNISAAIMIMLMSLQLHTPVQFTTFPPLLLVTTLFRLAISISTTRLILVEGDAGKIVATFGEVVTGGNLVVGLVIFLIITVVQFLVITKGADRVAEVGARFTLDGMPGKQMSVDADVRAGNMDQLDARIARQDLEREAKLFGAMDGAMKFVKGDATAGLVITAINIIGGIAIGMAQNGLPFGEALQLYALLTVGDGLVAQIPALLISVASGTMVTRVTNPNGMDLGNEIGQQLLANSRTVIIAGVVIAFFGFVPGFPTLIFLTVGLAMSGSVALTARRQADKKANAMFDWSSIQGENNAACDDIERRTGAKESLLLVLPSVAESWDPAVFNNIFESLRNKTSDDWGVPVGHWRFSLDYNTGNDYQVFIKQEMVAKGTMQTDTVFVKANASYLEGLDIPVAEHFGLNEGALISQDHVHLLDENNIQHLGSLEQVYVHLQKCIVDNLDKFVGFQDTVALLTALQASNPGLVADLREALSIHQISLVLQQLLSERVPITSRVRILESILQVAQKRPETTYMVQQVRIAISDFLCKRFAEDSFLPAVVTSPALESFFREGLRETSDGNFLVLDPVVTTNIVDQVKKLISGPFLRGTHPVIITQQDTRYTFSKTLQEHGLYVPILAYQEIVPETIVYPVGFIVPDNDTA